VVVACVAVAVAAPGGRAAAEPFDGVHVLILRQTNRGRAEVGVGAAGEGAELAARYHLRDRWTLGVRERFALDATSRGTEVELGWSVGRGKMLLPGPAIARTDLYVRAGGGIDGDRDPTGFVGVAWRVAPIEWLTIDLGARARSTRMANVSTSARAIVVAPPANDRAWTTELGVWVSVLSPSHHECIAR
jgi:hypothetical protein